MPPSGRKGKTRARRAPTTTETHNNEHHSDVEPEVLATPSRASRKRARGSDLVVTSSRNTRRKTKDTRNPDPQDDEGTEAQDASDNETEPSTPTEDDILHSLKVADRQVHAVDDFANELLEGQEVVPGYGKIAGRDWVYIIRKVEVNIGRPEEHQRLDGEGDGNHPTTPTAKTVVDIDLGPDRQVSRLHAVIAYDPASSRWFAMVNGRNGLRIDNNLHKRGAKAYLRNGSVIEINNTQMAFITTATEENVGPVWDASIIKQAQKSSEEDEDGDDDPRSTNNPRHAHNGRTSLQDTGMYQSDYTGQQHSQPSNGQSQQRMHPHSQRATLQATPGTPMRSQSAFPKSSPAATYSRGMMMESTENIDYSAESAKDLKPPHSYAQLIGMAILSTEERQMALNGIYKWIMTNYAFYRFNTAGWQNSIRHNLSLNKAFAKTPRRSDEPGKGMKWMIEPAEFDTFVQQGMKGCRRPNPIPGTQSITNSPNSPMGRARGSIKRDTDLTPPLNTYRPPFSTATEAYTPERGPRRPANGQPESSVGLGIGGSTLVDYDYPQRATPRNGMNVIANAAGSPPALYVNDEGRTGPLDTPFPLRPSQRLAPPSTLRRPSDFIQFSSPAPFWKMEGLVGSTPFKPFDLSPLKTPFPALKKVEGEPAPKQEEQGSPVERESASEEVKDGSTGQDGSHSPIVESSSPPMRNPSGSALDASPTASRPATAVAKMLSQLSQSASEQQPTQQAPDSTPPGANGPQKSAEAQQQHTPPTTASTSSQPAVRAHELPQASVVSNFDAAHAVHNSHNGMNNASIYSNPYHPSASQTNGYRHPSVNSSAVAAAVVDDDDEGIDLVKGFQPIGAFHQRNHLAMSMGMAGGPVAPGFGR